MKEKEKMSKLQGWTVYVNNFVEDDVNIRREKMNVLHLCQKVQIIHFR